MGRELVDEAMKVQAITFDCAETLVSVNWDPARLAIDSALAVGLSIEDRDHANSEYQRVLARQMPAYREICLSGDLAESDRFWEGITSLWAETIGFSAQQAAEIHSRAIEGFYGEDSEVFRLFEDVRPALDELKSLGYRMGVLSNWDISLHRVIEGFGLQGYFEFVLASMEHGVEKPDPRFFGIAEERFQLTAEEILHVGDNPVDDLRGAREAGFQGLLVDRQAEGEFDHLVKALTEIPKRLQK